MVTLQATYTQRDRFGKSTTSQVNYEGETKNEALAKFFRADNSMKYSGNSVRLDKPEDRQAYKVWLSDINNYASNGGDMW